MNRIKIYRDMVHVNGVDIFYRDTQTDGPAILCLHGRWGRGETWIDFIEHYGEKFRIIAPDQRGHGLSGKPISKYTAAEMAEDMLALLDHLQIGPVILLGHSMGGHVAGTLAASHPEYVRALALLDKSANGPETPNPLALEEIEIIDPITKDWPLPFASLLESQEYIRKDMESELSYQYFMNSLIERPDGYHMLFSTQAMAANIAYYENWFQHLPEIKCPVMLVRASGHAAVPDEDFSRMQSLLADCSAYEMSDPDHNVHLGNKSDFYAYFDDFLKRIAS